MTSLAQTVEIALPVPFRHTFTYAVPPSYQGMIQIGTRVLVPFRKRRLVGIVMGLQRESPPQEDLEIKPLLEILDSEPILSEQQFRLCQWVADYYFAPIGEVIRATCPPALTASRRKLIRVTEKGIQRLQEFKSRQAASLFTEETAPPLPEALLEIIAAQGEVDLLTLERKRSGEVLREALRQLQTRHEIEIRTETGSRLIKNKLETVAKLWGDGETQGTEEKLTPKQKRVVEFLASKPEGVPVGDVESALNVSFAVLRTMSAKCRIVLVPTPVERTPLERAGAISETPPLELTADQKRALRIVMDSIQGAHFSPLVLYGVTASGKTEVYLRAMERVLAEGGTALMLVPEISLTPATARLFAARFSNQVAILHSGLSDGERHDEWWRIKRGEARVVVGTRSAVFAPLENLRLIVVDEEHEGSYKQQESPRYHGRDVAVMRAKLSNATVVLGSATPSLESFSNAQRGKYHLVALKNRVESRALAQVRIVDMREEFKDTRKNHILSRALVAAIEMRLKAEEQVLVLLNRRGYASFVVCRACGSTRQCPNCSITMTYHRRRDLLLCHYCGSIRPVPKRCWQCESEHLYFMGQGTEQVEDKLRETFPLARLGRLDRDTVQGRSAYQRILSDFSAGMTNILVGTQMIAKGHDFPRVTLVGVLHADGALGFPDFRSAERTFQLLTQVAGRSGRGTVPGEVILQAYYPEHYALRAAAKQNFIEFFNKEVHFRQMMHYPPFTQLALVGVRHTQFEAAMKLAKEVGEHLRIHAAPEVRILGPAIAPLARVKKEFRWQLLIKAKKHAALKTTVEHCLEFCEEKKILEPNVFVDMDPASLM